MGCGLSTNRITRFLKRNSVNELPESPEKSNSEMESSETCNQQNLDKFIISTDSDSHDSTKNSSLDKTNSTIEGDHKLPSTDQEKNKNENAVITKLTTEEIIKKQKEYVKQLEDTMLLMVNVPFRHLDQDNAPFTKEFRKSILKLAKSYFYFKADEIPYPMICEYRREVGQALCTNGAIRIMCDVLSDGIKRRDFIEDSKQMNNECWFPIKNILLTLLNFSDMDERVRISLTDHPEAFVLIVLVLREWQKDHLDQESTEDQNKMIKWSLSILHNCARSDENVQRLRDLGVIEVVLPYLDSKNENIRLSSISVIALLVNEQEAELLGTHVSIFQFLIKKLCKALKKEDRKDSGWSAAELTTVLGKLARNDANKKVLVEEGCLPPLLEQLSTGDEKEIKEAINCLWTLSFDDDNKKKMVDEPGLVKAVYEKYLLPDSRWRHDCQGALWSLREQLLASSEYRIIGEEISNTSGSTTDSIRAVSLPGGPTKASGLQKVKGHVMISYQWANQDIIKQICQALRCHEIPVWIDIDYMGGSTLQAMAKAVEGSVVVIMAISQKYKDSPNTRAEAEYTFQQRKTIIPLIMQRGYHPDGWLGLILGSKFYYDFSGKYTFQSRMDSLLAAVKAVLYGAKKRGGGDEVKQTTVQLTGSSPTTQEASSPNSTPTPKMDKKSIMTWTTDDIRKWLTKYQMENSTILQLLPEEILFLHDLKSEAPEFFYRCLESKLNLTSLLDLGRAAKAFADIMHH